MEFKRDLRGKRKWLFLLVVLVFSLQTGDAFSWIQEPNDPTKAEEGEEIELKWDYSLDSGETFDELQFFDLDLGNTIAKRKSANGKLVLNPALPLSSRLNITGKATMIITKVNRTDAGGYNCKLLTNKDSFGTSARGVQLEVLYPPENISFHTSANISATIKNSTVNFTCIAEGNPAPYEYEFYYDNMKYLGNSSSGIFQSRVTETGYYFCVPVNTVNTVNMMKSLGERVKKSVHINIVEPAAVSLLPHHVTEGHNISLTCIVTGSQPLSIKWTKVNGDSKVLSNTSVLTLLNVTRPGNSNETVQYQCTASNGYGEPASATVTVQVHYKPDNTQCRTLNSTFQKGKDNVTFYFSAESRPEECNVSLVRNGSEQHVLVNGSCNGSRTKLGTVATDNMKGGVHVFTCSPENRVGHGTEASVNITITEPAEVNISANTVEVFQNSTVLLCLTVKGYPPPTVTCVAPDGKEFGTLKCTNVKILSGPTATYRCNATNELGMDSTFVKLDVFRFTSNDTKLTGQFKIVGTFTKELADENIVEAKTFKNKVITELYELFDGKEKKPLSIEIVLRNGSIIVDYTLFFRGSVDEVTGTGPIKEAVSNGNLGSFNVSSFVPKTTAVPPTTGINAASPTTGINAASPTTGINAVPPTNDARTCKDCDKSSTGIIVGVGVGVGVVIILIIVVIWWCKKKKRCPKGSGDAKQGQDVVKGNDTPLAMQNMGYANEGPSACDGSGYVQVENGPAPGAAEGNYAEVGKAGAAGGVPLVTYAAVDQSKKKKKKKTKGEKLEEDDMQGTATYAQVDKSKKKNGAAVPEENTYAAVDMSKKKKKRKEGELFYADLSEFSGQRGGLTSVQVSPPPTPGPVKVPSKYEGTEYADILQFSSKKKEDKPVVGEEGKPEQQKPAADAAGLDGGIVVKEQEGSKDEQGQMEAKL